MDDSREQIYDERINPLMAQIISICKENNIPFVASFQLSDDNDDDGALMCTSCSLPDGTVKRLDEAANIIYQRNTTLILTTITKQEVRP